MKTRNLALAAAIILLCGTAAQAQQHTGNAGLFHVPSADMDEVGTARIGFYYLNDAFQSLSANTEHWGLSGTAVGYQLAYTPYKWLSVGYIANVQKGEETKYFQDRHFSIKVQPLREQEGKWWPSVAIGTDDPYTSEAGNYNNCFFSNYYLALTKHFNILGGSLGVHAGYRYYTRTYNSQWTSVVGGVSYSPNFFPGLRVLAEYTGQEVNIAADCVLWDRVMLQVGLQDFKYVSGGICFLFNLKK